MKATLLKLRLSYFKGIKSLDVDFSDSENYIYGKNEAGKTTVFDSLWYLFFGKDSTGRSDFAVKTLDANNKVIDKVDHEVEGTFLIERGNGMPETKTFKRTLKEQWSKTSNTLTGHTTDYHVDGFPVRTETEFKKIISEYFSEELFKLLTNPLFFNSKKPADMRTELIALVPEVTNSDIFGSLTTKDRKSPHIQDLERLLAEGKKIDQIKLKASQDKKTYKDEKDAIPGRIDEAERNKPEAVDFEEIEEIISAKKGELADIDQAIQDENNVAAQKNKAIQAIQNQIFERKTKLQSMEFKAESDLRKFNQEQNVYPDSVKDQIDSINHQGTGKQKLILQKQQEIDREKSQIQSLTELLGLLNADVEKLRAQWATENEKEFTWNGESCTACRRPFEGAMALDAESTARANFNNAKKETCDAIQLKGKGIASRITSTTADIDTRKENVRALSNEIATLTEQKDDLRQSITKLETELNEWYANPKESKTASDFYPEEYTVIQSEITELETTKPGEVKADLSEFQANKAIIQNTLEELQKVLGTKDTIENTDRRIAELNQMEKDLAQKISSAEGIENACFTFSKARMEMIESAINAKFDLVEFKMFEMQLNGNEKEICETIYKGVPFQDLNTAGKVQAGLDIINTLSRYYKVSLPIFIDNRESVTWIPPVQAQVINLVVDPSKDKLEVSTEFRPNRQQKAAGLIPELIEK